MPRISLWQDGAHGKDYIFIDRRISEMFTLGGTGINVHKYLGPTEQPGSTDATKPNYINQSAQNIQDLLFLENRDRKYDTSVYNLRGIYQTADVDFNLEQFGIFLSNDTLFILFHIKDTVEMLGRKIISGDVLELQHKKDYWGLDETIPVALKRYYVIQDVAFASEGFSPTWWPHLLRAKVVPLVDSQEYKDILNNISAGDDTTDTLAQILSTYDKNININDAIVTQAEAETPKSGYDTTQMYTVPVDEDLAALGNPETVIGADGSTVDAEVTTPDKSIQGYLTGDGLAPNGFPVTSGIAFPNNPSVGEYVLRMDYLPHRLFRFDGKRWVKVEEAVRDNYTPGSATNFKAEFVNNPGNVVIGSETVPSRQGLSKALGNRKKIT